MGEKKGLFASTDTMDKSENNGGVGETKTSFKYRHKDAKSNRFTEGAGSGFRNKEKRGLFAGVGVLDEVKDNSGARQTKNNFKHYSKTTGPSEFIEEVSSGLKNEKKKGLFSGVGAADKFKNNNKTEEGDFSFKKYYKNTKSGSFEEEVISGLDSKKKKRFICKT